MRYLRLWLLAFLFLAACSGGDESRVLPTLARLPTLAPTPSSLPYSYEVDGMRITILEVVPATRRHGFASEDIREWTANFQFENTLNVDWDVIGCAGMEHFRLKTDAGNIYSAKYVGGSNVCVKYRPRQTIVQDELYIFQIPEDETPIELWGFNERPPRNQVGQPTIVFRLAQ